MNASLVLPTYNRCPFDPYGPEANCNPLVWALETLFCQQGNALREIVVVDDGSEDYTAEVLKLYLERQHSDNVSLKIITHESHKGLTAARNTGINESTRDVLVFGDDDCIYTPYYVYGAVVCLEYLLREDDSTCAVTLPFYYRSLYPHDNCSSQQIGYLDVDNGQFSTNFHCFPTEYINKPLYIDEQNKIYRPIRVSLLNGTSALLAGWLRNIGGFPDLSVWKNAYSEHLELSSEICASGGHIYHCPDPKFSASHLKFGTLGRYKMYDDELEKEIHPIGMKFKQLVEISSKTRSNTGCRVTPDEFFNNMVGSFFAFFLGQSVRGGITYALDSYQEFVIQGSIRSLALSEAPEASVRESVWKQAIEQASVVVVNRSRNSRKRSEVEVVLKGITDKIGIHFNPAF